jgi:hypothetical protein
MAHSLGTASGLTAVAVTSQGTSHLSAPNPRAEPSHRPASKRGREEADLSRTSDDSAEDALSVVPVCAYVAAGALAIC